MRLESSYGAIVASDSPLIPWTVTHAGTLVSKFLEGADGRTPWERMQGQRRMNAQAAVGECVAHLIPESEGNEMADSRWGEGIHLGMRNRSEEYYIETEKE